MKSRLLTCWYALRGWAIISGLEIERGEVWFSGARRQSDNLFVSDRAKIQSCTIYVRGPVVFRGGGDNSGNWGNAIQGSAIQELPR